LYEGDDSQFYLDQNIGRLQSWVTKVQANDDWEVYEGNNYKIKFTCAGDLMFLQACKHYLPPWQLNLHSIPSFLLLLSGYKG
jgi:hypothetical protein